MNKDKQYPDEYKLTSSLTTQIAFFLILGPLVFMWCEWDWQEDWLFVCLFSIVCLFALFCIMQNVEYAIFNHKGILIVHTKRLSKTKADQEFYIDWKDVKYIKFENIYSKHSKINIRSRIFGRGYCWRSNLSYSKFASLAKYYSGREDIIDNKSGVRLKRKPFEKDW